MTLTVNSNTNLTTNQTPASGNAVQYGADGVFLTIDTAVAVVAQGAGADGIFSTKVNSFLTNKGSITSSGFIGVDFEGFSGGTIHNNAGASIVGFFDAIFVENGQPNNGTFIDNNGFLSGLGSAGIFFGEFSSGFGVDNAGDIFGAAEGIEVKSDLDGGFLSNSGTIRSDHIGINVNTQSTLITVITNSAGATITGPDEAIHSALGTISVLNQGTLNGQILCDNADFASNDTINNLGTINGAVGLGLGNDLFTNKGTINGEVHLGAGADKFTGTGGGAVSVFGEAGLDTLTGGDNNDVLDGGASKDTVTGGLGRDTLTGGAKADRFDFNSTTESVVGPNHDEITDFGRRSGDVIDLSTIDAQTGASGDQTFTFIGGQAFGHHAGELHFVKEGAFLLVQGDVDGDANADFEIRVDNMLRLLADDFVL